QARFMMELLLGLLTEKDIEALTQQPVNKNLYKRYQDDRVLYKESMAAYIPMFERDLEKEVILGVIGENSSAQEVPTLTEVERFTEGIAEYKQRHPYLPWSK